MQRYELHGPPSGGKFWYDIRQFCIDKCVPSFWLKFYDRDNCIVTVTCDGPTIVELKLLFSTEIHYIDALAIS